MNLTPEIRDRILAALTEHPERALVLPEHCYDKDGYVPIYSAGLQVMLHRWLYEKLIGPLNGRQIYDKSGVKGNVNPYLFSFTLSPVKVKPPSRHNRYKTHCPAGHPYTKKNTLVFSDGKRRCRTCRYRKLDDPGTEAPGSKGPLERNVDQTTRPQHESPRHAAGGIVDPLC